LARRPCARLARDAVGQLGDAPIHHQDFAEVADHDVGGLQVAVDDAARVGVRNGLTDVEKDVEETPEPDFAERLWVRGRLALLEKALERLAANELHRVVRAAFRIDPEIVNGDDVRVLELRRDLRLLHEAREELDRKLRPRHRRDLQRDLATQLRIGAPQHAAHRAATELLAGSNAAAPERRTVVRDRARARRFRRCGWDPHGHAWLARVLPTLSRVSRHGRWCPT
jgi:hypothetical protein